MGFKSSETVPESADVVIVGCGITGSSAARFLTEQNADLDVVVLEAREVCWGATGRVRDFFVCHLSRKSSSFGDRLIKWVGIKVGRCTKIVVPEWRTSATSPLRPNA